MMEIEDAMYSLEFTLYNASVLKALIFPYKLMNSLESGQLRASTLHNFGRFRQSDIETSYTLSFVTYLSHCARRNGWSITRM